jgi:hypothetical protein
MVQALDGSNGWLQGRATYDLIRDWNLAPHHTSQEGKGAEVDLTTSYKVI